MSFFFAQEMSMFFIFMHVQNNMHVLNNINRNLRNAVVTNSLRLARLHMDSVLAIKIIVSSWTWSTCNDFILFSVEKHKYNQFSFPYVQWIVIYV